LSLTSKDGGSEAFNGDMTLWPSFASSSLRAVFATFPPSDAICLL